MTSFWLKTAEPIQTKLQREPALSSPRNKKRQTRLATAVHKYKRRERYRSTIRLPHGPDGDSGGPTASSTNTNTYYTRDCHRLSRMLSDSQQEVEHTQLTNNYIALMNPLQHYLKVFEGKIRWTPARLESRNSMSANCDCMNHVANKIATGKVDFGYDCQNDLMELQVDSSNHPKQLVPADEGRNHP